MTGGGTVPLTGGGTVPFRGGWVPLTGGTVLELTGVLAVSLFVALAYASGLYAPPPSGAPAAARLAAKTKHAKLKTAVRDTVNTCESRMLRSESGILISLIS